MHNDTSSHIYTIQMQGGNKSMRATEYVAEAAYLDPTRYVDVYVGWKDDFMVIRSSFDPTSLPSTNYPLEKLAGYEVNSIVGQGKLYGVAAGKNASDQWHYVAVGSSGTILKSSDGFNWSPQAQTSQYTGIMHVAISEKPNANSDEAIAIVTENNKILYSTDLGATWQPVHRIALKGQVIDIRFVKTSGTTKLYITENISSSGKVNLYTVTSAKEVTTTTIDDFVVSGVTTDSMGPVLYGKRNTADVAKIATYDWRSYLVTRTYDAVPNDYMSIPAITNLTLYANMGSKDFFINGSGIYMSSYNGSSAPQYPNTYGINALNIRSLGSVSYKYYTQVGNHYLFMSDTGEVRVSKDLVDNPNTTYFSDTTYFTGKVLTPRFAITDMIQTNGLLVALDTDNQIFTSYNGIEWTRHDRLSYDHEDMFNNTYQATVSMGHNSNKIVLGHETSSITILTVPYHAISENKVTPYPQATYVAPGVSPLRTTVTARLLIY